VVLDGGGTWRATSHLAMLRGRSGVIGISTMESAGLTQSKALRLRKRSTGILPVSGHGQDGHATAAETLGGARPPHTRGQRRATALDHGPALLAPTRAETQSFALRNPKIVPWPSRPCPSTGGTPVAQNPFRSAQFNGYGLNEVQPGPSARRRHRGFGALATARPYVLCCGHAARGRATRGRATFPLYCAAHTTPHRYRRLGSGR
jgi:hypothetical protein